MNILFFDTETTGFPTAAPHDDPKQARCVQIGAILTDETGKTEGELNLIIKPEGFFIPIFVAAIHGISQERAEKVGVPHKVAIAGFYQLVKLADLVVAHNFDFDKKVMKLEFLWCTKDEVIEHKKSFCTMKAMTDICMLPATRGNSYKWPKMQEAHQFCFGKEFDGAHDAMADVRACRDVFFWMVQNGHICLENLISG